MIPLQMAAIAVTALGALVVVVVRDVIRQAILVSFYGLGLTAGFFAIE